MAAISGVDISGIEISGDEQVNLPTSPFIIPVVFGGFDSIVRQFRVIGIILLALLL